MAWVTPKTNWVDGDYFNRDPDYNRIKGNIEYLVELSKEVYLDYTHTSLSYLVVDEYPTFRFFNAVYAITNAMLTNCYSPRGTQVMRSPVANGAVWNAAELNAIEGNHLRLYNALRGQKDGIRRLQYTLGGAKFGN